MTAAAPSTTFLAIKTKTRRLVRAPSVNQLTEVKLEDYINTAIVYDFPSELRLFSLRTLLTFYTQPNVGEYDTTISPTPTTDPLFNFKNKYLAIHPPVYIRGIQASFTQHRNVFFGYFPQNAPARDTQHRGSGTPGPFTGTLSASILPNTVIFSANQSDGTAQILVDYPQSNTFAYLDIPGKKASDVTTDTFGEINYLTGVYTVTFPNNVVSQEIVWATTQTYQAGQPTSLLYYDNKFTVRPIPDKVYPIQMEVDIRPTYLMENESIPELEGYWQYIAYLAAKKIFEDRMDTDSIQRIMPELKNQETLLLRRTITQQANERTVTIYTQGKSPYGYNFFGNWPF